MDWLGKFAEMNANAMIVVLAVITLVIALIAVVILAIRKGWFSFSKSNGLQIGLSELDTRNLILSQIEYMKAKCEGVIIKLPKDLDPFRTKYVIARIEDILEHAIIFNNISDDEYYIRAKQELVYQNVMKRVSNEYFMTDEFKDFVYKFVDELFRELVRMKRCFN